jgi:hypothetical protein
VRPYRHRREVHMAIRDGHHRVAVAHTRGAATIAAWIA